MGQKQRRTRRGAQGKRAARGAIGKFQRPGQARDFGPRDFRPAKDKGWISKARTEKGGSCHRTDASANSRRAVAAGRRRFLCFLHCPGHGDSMPPARKKKNPDLSTRLLAWYDVHRRVLPWRTPAGKRADPYKVWLSEIMLQQTTVQAVAGYYRKFLKAWPDVTALADASQDEVLAAWAGLGYYARARNLHAAAKMVAHELGGKFPTTAEGLRVLPGVGGYTSGAI